MEGRATKEGKESERRKGLYRNKMLWIRIAKEETAPKEEKCGDLKEKNSCFALIGREFYRRPPIHGCGSANLVSMAEPIHAHPS